MAARIGLLLVMVVLLAGCVFPGGGVTVGGTGEVIVGSGKTVTKEYDFSDFSRITAGNAFRVDVRQGNEYSVVVTVDDNIEEYLDVQQNGDEVRILLEPRILLSLRNVNLEARITMPEVAGLNLSGATRTTVTGFEGSKPLEVEVSGASRLNGDIVSGDARFNVSGASQVDLTGGAPTIDAEASGASTLRLGEFPTTDARIRASGASRITVNATGRITGSASGASTVEYVGDPASVRVDTSGASSVRGR